MRIITEYNLSAKEIVRKFKGLETNEFVKLWLEETNLVMCVIFCYNSHFIDFGIGNNMYLFISIL